MRRLLLSTALVVVIPTALHAQAARIGRLPLLDSLSLRHSCGAAEPTTFLRESGVVGIHTVTDSTTGRLITVGVDQRQRPAYFSSVMSTRDDRRRESETLTALFRNGRVIHGDRSGFTTGVPTRLSDDRRGSLLSTDTSRIVALAREVLRRCS